MAGLLTNSRCWSGMTHGSNIEKLGLICRPSLPWAISHCFAPFAQQPSASRYRIHFACRDEKNRSRGAWAEFEVRDQTLSLLRFAPKSSLDWGRLGAFDDSG